MPGLGMMLVLIHPANQQRLTIKQQLAIRDLNRAESNIASFTVNERTLLIDELYH